MLERLSRHDGTTRLLTPRLLQLLLNTLAAQSATPIHPQLALITTGMEGPRCKRGKPQHRRTAHPPMGDQHSATLFKALITSL